MYSSAAKTLYGFEDCLNISSSVLQANIFQACFEPEYSVALRTIEPHLKFVYAFKKDIKYFSFSLLENLQHSAPLEIILFHFLCMTSDIEKQVWLCELIW